MYFHCAIISLCASIFVAAPALAQLTRPTSPSASTPSEAIQNDAKTHFLRGQAAFQQGDYENAIKEWQLAYAKDPRPLLQYNLAQAYERLGKLSDAVTALDKYLATAEPQDPRQSDARARRASISERIRQTGIHIKGGPEGAAIFVDDKPWGRTPRPDKIELAPGSHGVSVKLDGYRDFTSMVYVPAGQTIDVTVQMQRAPETKSGQNQNDQFKLVKRRKSTVIPWTLIGAGAAAVVAGSVLGIMALGKAGDSSTRDSSQADTARTLALGADIAIGAGIVAAGIGTVLLVLNANEVEYVPVQPQRGSPFSWSPRLGPRLVGVTSTLKF